MIGLSISQVARQAGVNLETIRFYERRGLLAKPARTRSGYRAFSPDAVRRVLFIRRTQEIGFSLKEIRELLILQLDPSTTCTEVRGRARLKLDDVENKIRDLQRIKTALLRLAAVCPGIGPTSGCPILEYVEGRSPSDAFPSLPNGGAPPSTQPKSPTKAKGVFR